jgi:flagellar biosynthesis/type III secretory pathway M-ring protein FliF/YscJ
LKRRKKKLAAFLQTPASLPAPGATENEAARKEIAAARDAQLQAAETAQKALETPDIAAQVETLRQNVRESVSRDPALAAGVIRTWIAEAEA